VLNLSAVTLRNRHIISLPAYKVPDIPSVIGEITKDSSTPSALDISRDIQVEQEGPDLTNISKN